MFDLLRPTVRVGLLAAAALLLAPPLRPQSFTAITVAEAQPDECYNEIGGPYIPFDGGCPPGTFEKRNQTYAWSLTKHGDKVYVGTGPNITCFGAAGGMAPPFKAPFTLVCEFDLTQFPNVPFDLASFLGDWRPPRIWCYDTTNGQQTDITPDDPRVNILMGFRAAGECDGVLLFAGPTAIGLGTIFFAFDAETGEYLGSQVERQWSNIRKTLKVDGVLYTAVQRTFGGGSVLRWRGSRDNPFAWETVGLLDNDGANIAYHDGRLYVATWTPTPAGSFLGILNPGGGPPSGIWQSPVIPEGGLNFFSQFFWRKAWSVTDYEPDPVLARTMLVGDLSSFDGKLVWGLMQAFREGQRAIIRTYGEGANTRETIENAQRSCAVLCGEFGAFTSDVELLYGAAELPVYNLFFGWITAPNAMGGMAPRFGGPGFDNELALYYWTSAVAFGKLFCGTFDNGSGPFAVNPGGDLWCFNSLDEPAVAIDENGFDNPGTLGYRAMLSCPDVLYLGSANNWNLNPEGAWELIALTED